MTDTTTPQPEPTLPLDANDQRALFQAAAMATMTAEAILGYWAKTLADATRATFLSRVGSGFRPAVLVEVDPCDDSALGVSICLVNDLGAVETIGQLRLG